MKFPFAPRPRLRAFSLVEVCLALGIVSFAFLSIMGLTFIGFSGFQKAIGTTMETQIAQRLATQLRQTDFSELMAGGASTRHFDIEGLPVSAGEAVFTVTIDAPKHVALPQGGDMDESPNLVLVSFRITKRGSTTTPNAYQVYVANAGT